MVQKSSSDDPTLEMDVSNAIKNGILYLEDPIDRVSILLIFFKNN